MYNWEKCLLDVWFPVSLCVADVLLNPGHAGQGLLHCTRHRMQCEECLGILQMSVLVGSLPPVPALLLPTPQWSRAQGVSQSTALVQSYTGGNCCQSSDSFSALGTLLLDNGSKCSHSAFPFQAWRWKMLKKLCSNAISAFNSNVMLWSFISTRSILGEIRSSSQRFHGKENSFVVRRPSYD